MADRPVSDYIEKHVLEKLGRNGVLVWFDPSRSYGQLLGRIRLPVGTDVVRFSGSYLRLRAEADKVFGGLTRQDLSSGRGLLVYVPAARPPKQSGVLLGLTAAGDWVDADLYSFARSALRNKLAQAHLDEILGSPNLSLEELDEIASGGTGEGSGVVSVIFGPASSHEVAVRYLTEPGIEAAVDEKKALAPLAKLFEKAFGLSKGDVSHHASLKLRLGRHLLLTEFRAGLTDEAAASSLAGMPMPTGPQVEACQAAATRMRDSNRARESYADLAKRVQAEFSLDKADIAVANLGETITFPFEELMRLDFVETLVSKGRTDEALALVRTHKHSFWSQADPQLATQWQLAETAIRLFKASKVVQEEAKPGLSLGVLTQLYTDVNSGWYQVDTLQRVLEGHYLYMEDGFRLGRLLQRAREAQREATILVAERYLEALTRDGFRFEGIEHQQDVFARYVEPHLKGDPVAYILVDALRYEMAVELLQGISGAEKAEVRPAVAAIPTITPVGMAALMPGADKGITLLDTDTGSLAARVGGTILESAADRSKLIKGHTGGATLGLTLEQLFTRYKKPAAVRKDLSGVRLVLLRSTEIDAQGEQEPATQARRLMSHILGDLRKAIHILAGAGIRRFVVTADHGYILGDELQEPMKVDPPGGQTILLHRRCWIGRGGSPGHAFIRLKAADAGLGGDLELAFPKGLGAFKAQGGSNSYYHGGLSPQELVVPVLTFEMSVPQDHGTHDKVTIRMSGPRVTNRFFTVSLVYQPGTLLRTSRKVRCVLISGGEPVGYAATAEYGYNEVSQEITLEQHKENVVTLFLTADKTAGTLRVQLKDSETDAILAQEGPIQFDLTS